MPVAGGAVILRSVLRSLTPAREFARNDSKTPFAPKRDCHELIGEGPLGERRLRAPRPAGFAARSTAPIGHNVAITGKHMRISFIGSVLSSALLFGAALAAPASAQRPDSTMKRDSVRRDSAAKADSAAADSIRLVRELERLGSEPRRGNDTINPPTVSTGAVQGPINPRLLPDISAVGDLVGDLTPKHSTQEDQSRFGVREVELAFQAAVDPFFRSDVFLGLSDLEKVSIEQAYLTSTALPYGLEVRLGRYLMPVGKQNTTHRHDLHTVEYPYVVQRFFSPDGLKGTGVWLSKIFSPFGFYQEVQLTAVDRFGEAPEALTTAVPVNKRLGDIGYSARLRNYWDLSQSTNIELSGSAVTGKREEPLLEPVGEVNAVGVRQTVVGGDLTFRWRPLQQGLYKSFILQTEFMRELNPRNPSLADVGAPASFAGLTKDLNGAYVFARYQLSQRVFLGSRYDYVQDPQLDGNTLNAVSGVLEFFPSEFSKLVAQYERTMPTGAEKLNRILLQASFALGPHKPHPF